jgi:hypothetical protein
MDNPSDYLSKRAYRVNVVDVGKEDETGDLCSWIKRWVMDW